MKTIRFRHSSIDNQSFLFSMKESDEEYYLVSYELVRKLLIGMAKRSSVFCSKVFADYPFTYRERQLDSILLPELSKLCNGYVFAEYPVTRNSKLYDAKDSKGRIDYWCIYKNYSFVIEVKHSYDNYIIGKTKDETIRRWRTMNSYQLKSIKKYLKTFDEKTKGIIPLALHFITSESSKEPTNEHRDEYILKEREILIRLHNDLKHIAEPDFTSLWEIDKDMYIDYWHNGNTFPGFILVSKFYREIHHNGAGSYER